MPVDAVLLDCENVSVDESAFLPIVALLVMLLAIPGVRAALHFGAMSAAECVVAIAAGTIGVAWFEAYKLTRNKREPGR